MNVSWCEAVIAKRRNGLLESLKLRDRKVCLLFIISRSQMRHEPVNANVCESLQRGAEIPNIVGSHAQPTHSGVDFQMNIDSCSRILRGTIQRFDHVETVNNRREILLNARVFLTGPNAAQAQDRL